MSSDGSSTVVLFRALPPALKLSGLRLSGSDKRGLQQFARTLSAEVAAGRPFTCLFADDRELLRLNRQFLNRDYPADVLSFPADCGADSRADHCGADGREAPSASLGEIAISIQRAAHQAAQHQHPLLQEIRILMLHGVLHLTGFDHERDHGQMARAERKWRDVFGLPATLISRTKARQPSPPDESARKPSRSRIAGVRSS